MHHIFQSQYKSNFILTQVANFHLSNQLLNHSNIIIINIIFQMNFLKKTLGKDEPKKKEDKKNMEANKANEISKVLEASLGNPPKGQIWNNIDQLIESRAGRKNWDQTIEKNLGKIIQQGFAGKKNQLNQNDFREILLQVNDEFRKQLKFKNNLTTTSSPKSQPKLQQYIEITKILENILKKNQDNQNRIEIKIFAEKLKKMITQQEQAEKQQKLKQFDKLVSVLQNNRSPKKDFIIKYTKQQITLQKKNLQPNKNKLSKTKSGGNLSGSSQHLNNSTKKGSDGDPSSKLHNLLKDVSMKVVKTSIEYDYNAILESSISNIRKRKNVTTAKQEPKVPQKKISKNDAFVFFRPTTTKK